MLLAYRPLAVQTTKEETAKVLQDARQDAKSAEPAAAPKYAFHSIEPQPLKKRQTYSERVSKQEESQQQAMQEISAPSTVTEERRQDEEEPMSAYERVMARSRMQGEGLNHFFGTVMARRAGHSTDTEEAMPAPEASVPAPNVVEPDSTVEEAPVEEEAVLVPQRQQRSKEEITGTNSFLENAWQEKLKAMGHGSSGGSPYARLRVGKGKQRQDGDAPPE
jgi:hypothetical protein